MRGALALAVVPLLFAACLPGPGPSRSATLEAGLPLGFPSHAREPDSEQDERFVISEHGPTGVVPAENIGGGIWVLFSRPVVSLGRLSQPAESSTAISISPAVEGTYRWYGSRLLGFEPKAALAPATEYTIRASAGLTALDGRRLEGERTFTFRTEPLSVVSWSPSGDDVRPEDCRTIVLVFSFPVDLATIVPSIRLEAAGREVRFSARRPEAKDLVRRAPQIDASRAVSLVPAAELPRDCDVVVRVLPGARPRAGTYGSTTELEAGFHTLRPLEISSSDLWPAPTVMLTFNHPIKSETAAGNVVVQVPGYSVGDNIEVSGSRVWLGGIPVPWGSSFTVRVLGGLEDVYGQRLGSDRDIAFEAGPAPSYVVFPGTGQRLLESAFAPVVAVEMQNVESARYRMQAVAWPEPPQRQAPDRAIDLSRAAPNARHFELFDLAPLLGNGGTGAAFLSWDATGRFWGNEKPQTEHGSLVVQVTDIGATMALGWNRLVTRAASLATGAPLAGAEVSLRDRRSGAILAGGKTGSDGTARVDLPPGLLATLADRQEDLDIVVARPGDRLVLQPSEAMPRTWNASQPFVAEEASPVAHLWTDRGIYRPGETLAFAGTARMLRLGSYEPASGRWRVELSGSDRPVAWTEGTLSATGTFSGTLELPAGLGPDDYWLTFRREAKSTRGPSWEEASGTAPVKIAFFRNVSFSVSLAISPGRAFMGETLSGAFSGSYLAGGSVRRGRWSWWWSRREIWYQPPGDRLASYQFGHVEKPWAEELGSSDGALAGSGEVTATQKLSDPAQGRVYRYELAATIQDIDRQAISKQASALVFASELALGGKLTPVAGSDDPLYFVTKGKPFTLKVVGVDPDGGAYRPTDVTARLVREDWQLVREQGVGGYADTSWQRQENLERTIKLRTAADPVAVELATAKSGSYFIELAGKDRAGREAYTRISFYATGSDEVLWQRWDERQIEIVPDRTIYRPGDTARLMVKSPVARGTYVVTVEREGIMEERTVELSGGTPIVEVPVTEAHVPVFYVFVATASGRTAPPPSGPDLPDFGMPSGASGLVEIPVETASRRIDVAIASPRATWRPGTEASLTVTATHDGKPVEGAEIALVAADRGVLDLIDYHVPDPVALFYEAWRFPDRVTHFESRDLLLAPVTWKARDIPGGDDGKAGEAAPGAGAEAYLQRRTFNPTALFRTGLVTGRDGTVTVSFKLPDQLTRFRTTAVAVKGDMFGIAEDELLVQNPINVRAALPRRMRTDDRASAGVVMTNLDRTAHALTVSLEAEHAAVTGSRSKTVTLAPGATTEVPFDIATPTAGTASLAFTIDSDVLKEQLQQQLAVEESRVMESFTIIGRTSDRLEEGFVVPDRTLGAPGEGLYLSLDSTVASGLAGAVRFLELYPFDCLEQRTSKLFAWVLYPQLAAQSGIDAARISSELSALSKFESDDGGFSYWPGQPGRSDYYVSIRVAHLLAEARAHGIEVPPALDLRGLLDYLSSRWDRPSADADAALYLQGYALWVLSLHGRPNRVRAQQLLAKGDRIGLFGYGFLGLAFDSLGDRTTATKILDRMKSFMRVGTRSVTLVGSIHDAYWYGGELQGKALLLMLYDRLAQDSELEQALAADLLSSNRTGYWENTSSAGWVLQAFSGIVRREQAVRSDFIGKVDLGTALLSQHSFTGLSRAPFEATISPTELAAAAKGQQGSPVTGGRLLPLAFVVEGTGTLSYAATWRYAVEASTAEPRDEGIGVAVDILDEDGTIVDPGALALGRVYRMRVVLYSTRDRTLLAVRAPIASGAEPIDTSLATSEIPKPMADEEQEGWSWPDYTTQVFDNEVRFHFERFARGRRDVSFSFRTTSPGTFNVPPVQAELMYEPEVFGRTAGTSWRIAAGEGGQ